MVTPSRRAARAVVGDSVCRRPSVDCGLSRGGFRGGGLEFGALLAHRAAAGAACCALCATCRSDALAGHTSNGDKSAREHRWRLMVQSCWRLSPMDAAWCCCSMTVNMGCASWKHTRARAGLRAGNYNDLRRAGAMPALCCARQSAWMQEPLASRRTAGRRGSQVQLLRSAFCRGLSSTGSLVTRPPQDHVPHNFFTNLVGVRCGAVWARADRRPRVRFLQ